MRALRTDSGEEVVFLAGFLTLGALVSRSTIRSCLTNGFTQFYLLHALPLWAPTVLRGLILKESCGRIPFFLSFTDSLKLPRTVLCSVWDPLDTLNFFR